MAAPFTSETARAAVKKANDRRRQAVEDDAHFLNELRGMKPTAISILRSGLRSRDAKLKHESAKRVLDWLEKLDPTEQDKPDKIIYMTAALPHELFTQDPTDPDDLPPFVPGAA